VEASSLADTPAVRCLTAKFMAAWRTAEQKASLRHSIPTVAPSGGDGPRRVICGVGQSNKAIAQAAYPSDASAIGASAVLPRQREDW
jgi:hypothetical protein